MEPKKLLRSTNAQINLLTDYMSTHKNFANGKYTGPLGARRIAKEWEFLRGILKERGPDKSVDQWKQTWRDLKRKARKQSLEANAAMASTGDKDEVPIISASSIKILDTIRHGMSSGDDDETPKPDRTPKQLRRLWMNLKHRQKETAGQHQPHLSTEGNSSNDAIDANVMHGTQEITAGVDSSMDSDTIIETVDTGPVLSEPGIACLYLSEESQNIPNIDKPCYNTIKIESTSPVDVTHPLETFTPIDSKEIPIHVSPHIENNELFSIQHQENSTTMQENKSKEVRGREIHKWEIQFLKEKIKSHQQESMKREARATAIHELEHQLLKERVREAKAKADLAELLLRRQQY